MNAQPKASETAAPSYDYWQNALSGNFGAVHDGDAQLGFYRKRARRGGPFVPVAIFEHGGEIVALVDGRKADAAEIWTYCCENPVPEDWYRAVERGEPWPDVDASLAAPPPAGHNNPPTDEAEILQEQIEAASAGVKDYETIGDDVKAAKAQSLRSRLLELSRDADKRRDALKRPHQEAGKAIDDRWQPLVKAAKAAADVIAKAIGAHETRKANAAAEAQRKADEERRRQEQEAAKAAALGKPAPDPPPAVEPPPAPLPATSIKGGYGRAANVKVVKVVTAIIDEGALFGFLKTHPEMRDLMLKLAQRGVNAGHDVPGITVTEERKVT